MMESNDYDGDKGDFDDNDEENDQKTYKYYDFSIKKSQYLGINTW